ncbi:MAG TPA: VCBS repeat-containing protein, partial [Sphingomicrobium sp.]|nr:VCBS repeat-containing protein [Sphingomicrobium sp.]
TLTFAGGSLTVQSMPVGYLVAKVAYPGGVELKLVTGDVQSDFNGDLRSDILWRNDGGLISNWLGTDNGGFIINDPNALNSQALNQSVAGVADFNGDGRDDLLWRGTDGWLSVWRSDGTGGWPTYYDPYSGAGVGGSGPPRYQIAQIPLDWHVAGTGDFDGDGRDDILWRNDNGSISNWLASSATAAVGGFIVNDANAFSQVPTSWHIAGVGDFNGDGRDDILWRSDAGQLSNWLGQANGAFANNDANAFTAVPTDWHVIGTGDFNGDGRDDILWRSDAGQLSNWLGAATGGFVINDANAFTTVPINWQVVGVGDYNGDGRDDILWRSDTGQLSNWLGTASGGFANNDVNAFVSVPINWHVQPEPFLL